MVITTAAQVQRIAMVGITVPDMARSVAFYERVLGFEKVADIQIASGAHDALDGIVAGGARIVRIRLGEQIVELTQYASLLGRPVPAASRGNDLWFQHVAIVVSDMEKAYAQLRRHGVQQISLEPQTIPETNVSAAGIKAMKFRDPDHHPLELLWFPADKGLPQWHRPTDRLFLGIDHTAITVSDTEQSLAFYRDLLGLRVAGGALNTGITQERLDNLPNPRVRITALVPPETSPPFVEFLHYESPAGGRAIPPDSVAADLWYWQTSVVVEDIAASVAALRAAGVRFISSDIVTTNPLLGFSRASTVRDPDGHAVRLVQL